MASSGDMAISSVMALMRAGLTCERALLANDEREGKGAGGGGSGEETTSIHEMALY